jgi:hypothetical protein
MRHKTHIKKKRICILWYFCNDVIIKDYFDVSLPEMYLYVLYYNKRLFEFVVSCGLSDFSSGINYTHKCVCICRKLRQIQISLIFFSVFSPKYIGHSERNISVYKALLGVTSDFATKGLTKYVIFPCLVLRNRHL